jgi:hypothetical protein
MVDAAPTASSDATLGAALVLLKGAALAAPVLLVGAAAALPRPLVLGRRQASLRLLERLMHDG